MASVLGSDVTTSTMARVATALLGCWLMAAPGWYDMGSLDTAAWIIGPLLAAVGIVAASAVTRPVRWAAIPLGVLLAVAGVVAHPSPASTWTALGCGIAAIGLALPGPGSTAQFGGGWRARGDEG
jgi:hypothetical protein